MGLSAGFLAQVTEISSPAEDVLKIHTAWGGRRWDK